MDLGGEGRGTRQDENVFAIQTPVAIAIAVRYGAPNPATPAPLNAYRPPRSTRCPLAGV